MELVGDYKMNDIKSLEKARNMFETDEFSKVFYDIGKSDIEKAASLINDRSLSFSTLFILLPKIDALNLYKYLNYRNVSSLSVCANVLKDKDLTAKLNKLPKADSKADILKWMLKTGADDDGLNDKFDRVLDAVIALLIKEYNDKSIVPVAVDMLFKRHRKGKLTHDLVWALFQVKDISLLKIIAPYLRSKEQIDARFASKLLNFTQAENKEPYKAYRLWFKENNKFLDFTEESPNLSSNPMPLKVDLDAKYLGKKMPQKFTDDEKNRLEVFHEINDDEKNILSEYSYKIHKKSKRQWNDWINYPIGQQISLAKKGLGEKP